MSSLRTISTPSGALLNRFATYETHPPLYFLQLKAWEALGMRSLVKLRANSALWASVSLVLIYMLGCFYGGQPLGLLVLAMAALSPFHLAYSQELRPYAMGMAIGLAALLALERRSWIALGMLWTAMLYTHYWGTFVVLAQAVYGCLACHPLRSQAGDPWIPRQSLRGMTPILVCAGTAGLVFLPWLPILRMQLHTADQLIFWASAFSVKNLGKVFLAYSGILFNMASWTFYLPTKVWVLALIGIAFAGALTKGAMRGPRSAVWWLAIGLCVPWLLSLWKPTVFVWYRFTVLMLPPFLLLVAAGLLEIRPMALKLALGLILLGSEGWGAWTYFHSWQKANPKAVVQYIHWLRKPDTVVVRPLYFADLFGFYDQGTTSVLDEHVLDSGKKRAALRGKKIVLVAFDVPSDPVADAFLQEYQTLSARYFPGLAHLGITVYELK